MNHYSYYQNKYLKSPEYEVTFYAFFVISNHKQKHYRYGVCSQAAAGEEQGAE